VLTLVFRFLCWRRREPGHRSQICFVGKNAPELLPGMLHLFVRCLR
jgi:hypothetical protein